MSPAVGLRRALSTDASAPAGSGNDVSDKFWVGLATAASVRPQRTARTQQALARVDVSMVAAQYISTTVKERTAQRFKRGFEFYIARRREVPPTQWGYNVVRKLGLNTDNTMKHAWIHWYQKNTCTHIITETVLFKPNKSVAKIPVDSPHFTCRLQVSASRSCGAYVRSFANKAT